MPEAIHPYFSAIYSQNPVTKVNRDLSEIIKTISALPDVEEIIEEIDQAIEGELCGWWDDASDAYYLDEEGFFDGTDSARDHVKEQMSAKEWLTAIDSALKCRRQKSEESAKASSTYLENVVIRLTSQDIRFMIDSLQTAYEEDAQDSEDFNPLANEKSLLEASRNELTKLFLEYFSIPHPEQNPENLRNLDWIPDSLLEVLELNKIRDQIHEARDAALRRAKLLELLDQLGPLSYPKSQIEYLCEVISADIPRRRKVLDRIEALIDSWNSSSAKSTDREPS